MSQSRHWRKSLSATRWGLVTKVAYPTNEQSCADNWLVRLTADSEQRESALVELREFLLRGVRKSLSHRYNGDVDLEDVVQQALVKILSSLGTFRGDSRFTTWAMSIAIRIGMNSLRRQYYRDISLESVNTDGSCLIEIPIMDHTASDQLASRNSTLSLLQLLINTELTDRQRLAIRGTLDGLPIEEIASRLQSNRNAVYKLVHDARIRLRQGFESHGVTMEDVLETIT